MSNITALVNLFSKTILNPIVALLFAVGLLVFVYGLIEFLFNFDVKGDLHAKESGRNHMLWGIIGMFIMLCAYAIVRLIANTVGTTLPSF